MVKTSDYNSAAQPIDARRRVADHLAAQRETLNARDAEIERLKERIKNSRIIAKLLALIATLLAIALLMQKG